MERVTFLTILKRIRARSMPARGFTVIEMLVVIAIFIILTSVILVSQSTFNRTLLLTDTAYTLALSIRESQSLGLSSKTFANKINEGYGIHFDTSSNKSYIQFADIANGPLPIPAWCPTGTVGYPDAKPGNCLYDGASEIAQTYTFSQGYNLAGFCAYYNGASLGCSPFGITALDILFQRPNTSTIMSARLNSGSYVKVDTACIRIATPDGSTSTYVKVTQLGQISTANSCP